MITRLLIANRGEIAVRIARTAQRMGIETVGLYSEPDRDAPHVDAVDLAVALGGQTAAESYLRADLVLAAARAYGCDAVHPGYGFLAENAEFAQRVVDAGLTWVGPTPEQISLLGDKIAAKKAAVAAGVPTTPVYDATSLPADLAVPVLVKAAAGGGGRGMRIVHDRESLDAIVESASREALSAFGDGTVFVEPYISPARHIEVQIIGDRGGNVLHLGERDCSVQRRNQKVIEESPAPGLDPEIRRRLHEGAVALARSVGYVNAGTVEFLVGTDGTITFLEVNTRLQVEHPVTEAVTGLDLVELQLLVASGRPLPLTQEDVTFRGHAIEVRVVAERPAAGWLPSTGTLTGWDFGPTVRVDSGVRVGSMVGADYDSMLAKVIVHAPDRERAALLLRHALLRADVTGVATNLATLAAVLGEPDFLSGGATTDYLDRHPDLLTAGEFADEATRTSLLAGAVLHRVLHGVGGPWAFAPAGWRNLPTQGQRELWQAEDEPVAIEWRATSPTEFALLIGTPPEAGPDGTLLEDLRTAVTARALHVGDDAVALELDGLRRVIQVRGNPDGTVTTRTASGRATWSPVSALGSGAAVATSADLTAPLPGTVTAVKVAVGDVVTAGQVLVVVEAMKMEHSLVAPRDGVVDLLPVAVGDRVNDGDRLVRLADSP